MEIEEQVRRWADGESVHNDERDECCPDFSCCQPDLLAPIEERVAFRDRPEIRGELLMGFLGRAMSSMGKDVHVAGSIKGEG